jgi:uncharacterized protein (TIGR04222 family)
MPTRRRRIAIYSPRGMVGEPRTIAMDLLTNNALLEMPGPTFLHFYAVVSAIALVALNAAIRLESFDSRPAPRLPVRPDPYEIAFLRGGIDATIGLAIYSLQRRALIEIQPGGAITAIAGLGGPTHAIEARALDEVGSVSTLRELLASGALRAAVAGKCEDLRQRLARQGLLKPEGANRRSFALGGLAGLALGGLAVAKIVAAEAHGHRNVGFLCLETVVALGLLFLSVRTVTRTAANARGLAYLRQFKTAYSGRIFDLAGRESRFDPAAAGVALVAVGAIGFEALYGTSEDAIAREFKRQSAGGADGGGGDGGGGGGGCGGCGGGD